MARVRLTKDRIENLTFEKDGQWVTDTEVPQLLIRLTPTSKTYVARWTSKVSGKRIYTSIESFGSISVDEARNRARKLVGADVAPTIATLGDIYKLWDETYSSETGLRHAADFRSGWKNHIEPHFGKTKLSRLTNAELQKWYKTKRAEFPVSPSGVKRGTPYSAAAINRWVMYISKLCTIARKGGHMTGDPCEALEKSTPHRRVTIFVRDDVKALADNLDAVADKHPTGVALLRFMKIYPCRGIEARGMEWADLDLEAGTFTIPAHRYKTGKDKQFPLGMLQVKYLKDLPRLSDKYVFPAPKNINKPVSREHQRDVWKKVRPKPLGAHTLRKTIGSDMINAGMPLEVISKLLGHSSTLVTQQVYAHLSPAVAAKHLAMWAGLTDDDLPEPTQSEKEFGKILEHQAARAISEEYEA